MDNKNSKKGIIKIGAAISHDRSFMRWPHCMPPESEYLGEKYQHEAKDPYMVFDVIWKDSYWECRADGYGYLQINGDEGEYGNGSIYVNEKNGVVIINEEKDLRP